MAWLHYAVAGIFGLAVGVFVLRVWLHRLRSAALQAADEALAGERIVMREDSANLFGVRSRGMGQVRGNGVLTLTDRRLHFAMWLPRREVSIERARITGTETPRSFLGRSRLTPVLQVDFTNELGEQDAAAWLVRDLPEWTEALSERIHQ